MRPVALSANQPARRFYAGGRQIAAFRGTGTAASHEPEDWVASTTAVFGQAPTGLTVLPDGTALRDAIEADPLGWLGPEHVATRGTDAALLVKLLDAGQRLPVHAHPDVPFARRHLGLAHGKTEAWVVLEPADVWLGFARDVAPEELASWVQTQDVDAMLAAMHRRRLERGDAVLVPAGTPHAIGEGAFVVELQEPTDLSILLEWRGFDVDGRADGHLGLGFTDALGAVNRRGLSPDEVSRLWGSQAGRVGDLLPDAAPFFRAQRWLGPVTLEAGLAVLVVVAGSGTLESDGALLALRPGATVVAPASAGALELHGDDLEVVVCRPPAAPGVPGDRTA